MKIDNVKVRIEQWSEDGQSLESEVFLTCGKPYINYGFHVEGEIDLESGIYSLEFLPVDKAESGE